MSICYCMKQSETNGFWGLLIKTKRQTYFPPAPAVFLFLPVKLISIAMLYSSHQAYDIP